MADTLIDDETIDVRTSSNRPGASTTSSQITTTTRRPMYIETEVRTDTVTTRRMASAAANRSVHDVLENTKSPTLDRPPTSYSYSQGNSYAPGSRSGAYDISAASRRSSHGGYQNGTESTLASAFSSPSEFLSTVRTQLSNGYDAVRDRITQFTGHHGLAPNSPTRGLTSGGSRYTRTSSQSSATGSRSKGYNLRSRPVHSTPRDTDSDHTSHRKTTTKHRKEHNQQGEIDEEDDDEEEEEEHKGPQSYLNRAIHYIKRVFRSPIDIFDTVWNKLKALPWWLLIPLLLLVALFTIPPFACKPLKHLLHPKVNDACRDVQHLTKDLSGSTYDFTRRHTYDRGVRNLKQVYGSAQDLKNSVLNSLNDVYYSLKQTLRGSVGGVKNRVTDAVETTAENAKEYYDAGIQKVNHLIEELKQEREKILGARHTLKPDEEKELSAMVRKLIDEYAADETGQADFALEANGGKVVDTRCHEYTDEPRQNVVKFLGIPIVHMSKQPDIIIKHGRMPGQCFPFKGDRGSVVIRLAVPVVPTEFVLEHLSKSISIVGHINSAPNNFTVYALKDKHDKEGVVLGRYFYDAENGPALQRFKPQIANIPVVEYIEVQVTSNWGNPNYTCLYRFRVHGDMQTVSPTAA
ncbi:hypothetical protein I4U23_029821 [Adineta vaga]|nr:hypothetical protein I4U23_029821 [Adineta vaga]